MCRGLIGQLICTILVTQIVGEDSLQRLSKSNNMFAIELYKTLAKEEGNILFSPLSAYAVLSMAYQGAQGDTKTAFETALHVSDKNSVAESNYNLKEYLENVEGVNVSLVNKIYLQDSLVLKEQFKTVLRDKYENGVEFLDFHQVESTVRKINDFVAKSTRNKITDLFSQETLEEETLLVLINTLYFGGQWSIPFDGIFTVAAPFHLNKNNETVEAQTMRTIVPANINLRNDMNVSVLGLPFKNEKFSMIFILPKELDGLKELEHRLNYDELVELINALKYIPDMRVDLPKFKIEQFIDLKLPLTKIGLGNIFDKNLCNLTDMVEEKQLYVAKAIQKSFISIDEKGCEAATATALIASARSISDIFIANHPFLFAIIERFETSFTVLFMGRVSNPTL